MINFDTDNLIIFCYPTNAGGKFLVNSLGLSDDAVFQDARLAEQQLDGQFTINDKMQYLTDALSNVNDTWTDLNLGCAQLFGVDNLEYLNCTSTLMLEAKFYPVVDRLSTGSHKFFLISHSLPCLDRYMSVWKNAQVIIYENCKTFVTNRTPIDPETQKVWEQYKGSDWPDHAPKNLEELATYPEHVRLEVEHRRLGLYKSIAWPGKVLDSYQRELQKYKTNERIIFWDNDVYFDRDKTVDSIKRLYDRLALTNFNRNYVAKYYELWIDKLKEIKKK